MSRLRRLLRWRRCRRGLGLGRDTKHRTSDRLGDRSASSPKIAVSIAWFITSSLFGLGLGGHGWVGGRLTPGHCVCSFACG